MEYLDNPLLREQLAQVLPVNIRWKVQTLERFWWILALKKSVLDLTYCLVYLGLTLNTALTRVFLPQDNKLQSFCSRA